MELVGKVKVIGETQTFGEKGFKKRELVITTTDEQYPQDILIEFVQDNCSKLDNYKLGDGVKVGINVRGREWTNPKGEVKYFNSLQGWRIEDAGESTPNQPNLEPVDNTKEVEDDLPF